MKRILFSFGFLGMVFTANTQVLLSEDFNALTVGNLGTDVTGTTAAQGGWYTYAATGAANSDWQIVSESAGDNALQLKGNAGATAVSPNPSKTRWSSYDLSGGWTGRTSGNDVLYTEFFMNTGASTTSLNNFNVYLFSADGINLGGFNYISSTKVLKAVVYKDETANGGAINSYSYALGTAGAALTLTANTDVNLGFSYNKTSGQFSVFGAGAGANFYYTFSGAGAGKNIADVDILVTAGTGNTASATINFDDFQVEARCATFPTTPTFTAITPICSGTALTLPTSSTNTTPITGTWLPAVNNTATTTYTFTPTTGVCANTASQTVTVNQPVTPSFSQISAICSGAPLTLPTSSTNTTPITGTWLPAVNNTATTTYTFTAAGGQCSTGSPTMTVSVNQPTTPTFTAVSAICSGASLSALPLTSNNSITGTWLPALNNTATTLYTFTPTTGVCATTQTLTITVNQPTVTDFATTPSFCAGTSAPVLGTTSTNSITGTWNPATVDNSNSGAYIFTPTSGVCATSVTKNITVTPNVTPAFTIVSTVCTGGTAPALPLTSTNSISGTWNPSTVSNTVSGSYLFTPANGACATTTTASITVNSSPTTPTFNAIASFCAGTSAPSLPSSSLESITGSWSPSTISNTNSGSYTFTPTAGLCATTKSLSVTVTPTTTPTFTTPAAICVGGSAPVLPTTSNNSITGSWNPSNVSNTSTASYTFTANSGTCVNTASVTVTVSSATVPTFSIASTLCSGASAPTLPSTSNNSIAGSWSPSVVSNTSSNSYTFTPTGNSCVSPVVVPITVTTAVTPTFNTIQPICLGAVAPTLPTTSTNSVTGTWSPSTVSNLSTGSYVFTPSTTCASSYNITVYVSPNSVPTFNFGTSICTGAAAPILPSTSVESVPGTWTPATVSNTASATYLFTPSNGVCATTKSVAVNVSPVVIPSFNIPSIVCTGSVAPSLPLTSTNSIAGTWSPSTVSTTTSQSYLFTPSNGSCASLLATAITVSSCASIDETTTSLFKVYPNPSNDVITISFSDLMSANGTINFVAADGKLIEKREYTNSSVETFDVKSLNPGVYFFQIGSTIEKVVVQ